MLSVKTHHNQSALAQYCRTGEYLVIEGVKTENISQYRRLVFSNVLDSLTTAYPLTKKLLKKKRWNALVERFFAVHPAQNPQIWNMPQELIAYVEEFETQLIEQYPFFIELLWFEWYEVEVFMMPDVFRVEKCNPEMIYLNPEIRLMKFEYPVHLKKSSKITDQDKGLYFMSMHRHPETGSVEFTNLPIPFVEVLEQMAESPLKKKQIETILGKYANPETVSVALNQFLASAYSTALIYGKN